MAEPPCFIDYLYVNASEGSASGGHVARNRRPSTLRLRRAGMLADYLMTQNPCASIPSATLNFERKFSSATAAVSSTI